MYICVCMNICIYSMINGNRKYLKWATQIVVIRNQFREIVIVCLVVSAEDIDNKKINKKKKCLEMNGCFWPSPYTNNHAKVAIVA